MIKTFAFIQPSKPNRKTFLKAVGVVAVLALFVIGSTALLNNVVATPVSPREAMIRGWVSDLSDQDLTTARQSAQANLEAAGAEAVPALVTALHSNNPITRRNAADMLGYIASPTASEALQTSLNADPVPAVRANAAWALGAIKGANGLNALERASVVDTSANVREMASDAAVLVRQDLAMRAGLDPATVQAVAVANGENTVYLAHNRDLRVSNDGGAQWQTVAQTLPGLASTLTVNPTNPNILFAGMHSQGMWLSTDAGKTWQSLTRNFSNEAIGESTVTAITVDPANPLRVVMAHGIRIGGLGNEFYPLGILVSNDGGKSWGYVTDLTEGQIVTRLGVKDNKVYALTSDRVLIIPLSAG